jgi:hypothetical protein
MFYANNDVINSLTENLQGQYFCEDPEMGFTEDQVKECAENMSVFMPPALKLIGGAVVMYNNDICNAWYEEICPAKLKFY